MRILVAHYFTVSIHSINILKTFVFLNSGFHFSILKHSLIELNSGKFDYFDLFSKDLSVAYVTHYGHYMQHVHYVCV